MHPLPICFSEIRPAKRRERVEQTWHACVLLVGGPPMTIILLLLLLPLLLPLLSLSGAMGVTLIWSIFSG